LATTHFTRAEYWCGMNLVKRAGRSITKSNADRRKISCVNCPELPVYCRAMQRRITGTGIINTRIRNQRTAMPGGPCAMAP